MDPITWFQLISICFLGAVSPGPSLVLVINNTLSKGRTYGFATSLGHGFGIGWWAFLTAVGVTEVMLEYSGFLQIVQLCGACFLIYFGFRSIILKDPGQDQPLGVLDRNPNTIINGARQGFLISLLNPKIALFFLVVFSHLVHGNASWIETGLMGVSAAAIDALWYILVTLIITGSGINKLLRDKEKYLPRFSGMLLVLIGCYLIILMLLDFS